MLQFESQYDSRSPKVQLLMSSDSTLDEVLQAFEGFLRAAGYCFNGTVDILPDKKSIQPVDYPLDGMEDDLQ